jgi:hypothetical protein
LIGLQTIVLEFIISVGINLSLPFVRNFIQFNTIIATSTEENIKIEELLKNQLKSISLTKIPTLLTQDLNLQQITIKSYYCKKIISYGKHLLIVL